jgi:hypothetical protein
MVRDTFQHGQTAATTRPNSKRAACSGPGLDPSGRRAYTCCVGANDITNDFVRKVADDLRTRYSLDDAAVRALGARLAGSTGVRSAQNTSFAERFVEEHHETFDRLAH